MTIRRALPLLLALGACAEHAPQPDAPLDDDAAVDAATGVDAAPDPARLPRFVGHWLVEQPHHALYEATLYAFEADGALRALGSEPPDCGGHLAKHCVTGAVVREGTDLTCVFGDTWWSPDAATLVIAGACADGRARDIRLRLADDPAGNAAPGSGATVESVGGEAGWAHDGFDWVFRKCPDDSADPRCRLGR